MNINKLVASIISFCFIFAYSCGVTSAADSNQFVTIVNPVRISDYTSNPGESVSSEYSVISSNELPATWLLTYNSIADENVVNVTKSMNNMQELGIFLEITPKLAADSNVVYPDNVSWHHANAIFLSGYSQGDRVKLIDTVFASFKDVYGYYPTSVGSWWTDSFSLAYMKEKYNIIANLVCADQFATDGYQIWGTYWSTPYYPSMLHAGIPADDVSKIGVVTIQWAHRDPLSGYESSLYSTQDYFVKPVNQDINYFTKLLNIYTGSKLNEFGQITIGLESDFSPDTYKGIYSEQIQKVKELDDSDVVTVLKMSDFGKWYTNTFESTPSHVLHTKDILDSDAEVLWYQSTKYRIELVRIGDITSVIDFRTYHDDFREPYMVTPNGDHKLSINLPSLIDSMSNNNEKWEIGKGTWMFNEKDRVLNIGDTTITFKPEGMLVANLKTEIPNSVQSSKVLGLSSKDNIFNMQPLDNWIIGPDGYVFREFNQQSLSVFRSKKVILFSLILLLCVSALIFKIFSSNQISHYRKYILLVIFITLSSLISILYIRNSTVYYVSQAEVDTLDRLSRLTSGNVVVYDNQCIGCHWESKYMPAVYANKREYVQKLSGHPVIKNKSVFEAISQQIAKDEFEKLNPTYIYVTKYGRYAEKTPFSPGDLNIVLIYANANSELWRVKD
jgi:hypothetical protein